MGPGGRGQRGCHYVNLAGETAPEPDARASILIRRDHQRHGTPVVPSGQAAHKLGLSLGSTRIWLKANYLERDAVRGAHAAHDLKRQAFRDHEDGCPAVAGQLQALAQPVPLAAKNDDRADPRRHALGWPDEKTGGRYTERDKQDDQYRRHFAPSFAMSRPPTGTLRFRPIMKSHRSVQCLVLPVSRSGSQSKVRFRTSPERRRRCEAPTVPVRLTNYRVVVRADYCPRYTEWISGFGGTNLYEMDIANVCKADLVEIRGYCFR